MTGDVSVQLKTRRVVGVICPNFYVNIFFYEFIISFVNIC